jgi:hypothetical protein
MFRQQLERSPTTGEKYHDFKTFLKKPESVSRGCLLPTGILQSIMYHLMVHLIQDFFPFLHHLVPTICIDRQENKKFLDGNIIITILLYS